MSDQRPSPELPSADSRQRASTSPRRGFAQRLGELAQQRSWRWGAAFLALAIAGLVAVFLPTSLLGTAEERPLTYFKIGTGTPDASYFPIGGVIASAISNPPGSHPCASGGNCGVPGLLAVAQTTDGSIANVAALQNGSIDAGIIQADIAAAAFRGERPFDKSEPVANLAAIANLYQESLHIVVRADSGIEGIAALKGKRVAVGPENGDTRVTARLVLSAFGLSEKRIKPAFIPLNEAVAALAAGKIDAIFATGSYPIPALAELAKTTPLALLPIGGEPAETLRAEHDYFTADGIPTGIYAHVGGVTTLGVGALWIAETELDEELVYEITRALWHDATRKLLDKAGAIGARIRIETALNGLSIPLHPGAARFYKEMGLILPTLPQQDAGQP